MFKEVLTFKCCLHACRASFIDLLLDLGIDLQVNTQLVEKLKSAEKLDYGHDNDGSFYFQYRHKYPIE